MADFLDEAFPEQPEPPAAEAPIQEPEAAVVSTPETVTEPAPQPEVQPEPVAEKGGGYVPIDAMLTERERRQEAERRLAEFERQKAAPAAPDPFDSPDDYTAYMQRELQGALQKQKVDMSWAMAAQQHGEDTVQKARDWALEKAQTDQGFRSMLDTEFATQTLPINWLVQQHKRESDLQALGGMSLADYVEAEIAKRTPGQSSAAPTAAPVAVIPAHKPAVPPRSIASDASAPSAAPSENPMAGLDAIFSKR